MEQCLGGRLVLDTLKTLRQEIEDHLGSVNELKEGLRQDILPKPAALHWYELVKATGLPLVAGGLMDQPHLWLMQWELIGSVLAMHEAMNKQAEQMNQPKNLMAPQRLGY